MSALARCPKHGVLSKVLLTKQLNPDENGFRWMCLHCAGMKKRKQRKAACKRADGKEVES